MFIITKHLKLFVLVFLLLGNQSVMSASLSFTGNFTQDTDVQWFDFSIAADSSSVLINTLSLNGGTNVAGNSIAGGGFDPYIVLWNKMTGDWVFDTFGKNDGEEASISSNYYGTLLAGSYLVALTQNDNVALGNLIEGFAAGSGLTEFNPSAPFTGHGGGGSGHWALDIQNVDAPLSAVPTPGALPLFLMGLMALATMTRSKGGFTV